MKPIIRILGLIDLTCVLLILFSSLFPENWLMAGGGYLILKGGLFGLLGDIVSYFDLIVGLYLLLIVALGLSSTVVSVVAMLFLVQKAVFSLL